MLISFTDPVSQPRKGVVVVICLGFYKRSVSVNQRSGGIALNSLLEVTCLSTQEVCFVKIGREVGLERQTILKSPLVDIDPPAKLFLAVLFGYTVGLVEIYCGPVIGFCGTAGSRQVMVLTCICLVNQLILKVCRAAEVLGRIDQTL